MNIPLPHSCIPRELLEHPDLAPHFLAIRLPATATATDLQVRAYLLERALSLRARGILSSDLFDELNVRGLAMSAAVTNPATAPEPSDDRHPGADLRRVICTLARAGDVVFVRTRTANGPGCATGRIGSLDAHTLLISVNATARVTVPIASIVEIERVRKPKEAP